MMTYVLLNLVFLAALLLLLPNKATLPSKRWWLLLAIIIALTAVFDPLMITLKIFAYDPTKILGIYWFGAPIEDFFYAIFAVILVPLLWKKLERHG